MIDVSVILTVFEREKFLRRAIESALSQTFANYEVIVADDSNKPSIRQLCESFQCPHRLRYRGNKERLGVALNVRAAIEDAKGKYVSILNDDDYWGSTFLERLVAPLEENPNRAVAFADHWIIREDGSVDEPATESNSLRYGRKTLPEGDIKDPPGFVLMKNGVPLAMAALFRRNDLNLSLLTKEVVGAYDLWISCVLAASGRSFFYVPSRLTYYRLHEGSETARRAPDKSEPMIYILQEILRENWFPTMKGIIQARLADAYFRNGLDLLSFGK